MTFMPASDISEDPNLIYIGVQIKFATQKLITEYQNADWRLKLLTVVLARCARERGLGVQVTSIERTMEETQQLYIQAQKAPPTGPGVHDVRPCRGLDAVPYSLTGEHIYYLSDAAREVTVAMNRIIVYPRNYQAVIWHEVTGAHWHVQVPWDALELLPDIRRKGTST